MPDQPNIQEEIEPTSRPLWREAFVAFDWLALRASSVFRGINVRRGDGSAVVVIPGFMGTDGYLQTLYDWLKRIGYSPYMSDIGRNVECQNILSERLLNTVQRARTETGRRVHLIGHSLGGVLARGAATIEPENIASVITMASPFRGVRAHPMILRAAAVVRSRIHERRDDRPVPKECYSGFCSCPAVDSLRRPFPDSVKQTAIYTETDGVVDWRFCTNDPPLNNIKVEGTHVGLVFNPQVYRHVADLLADASEGPSEEEEPARGGFQTFG